MHTDQVYNFIISGSLSCRNFIYVVKKEKKTIQKMNDNLRPKYFITVLIVNYPLLLMALATQMCALGSVFGSSCSFLDFLFGLERASSADFFTKHEKDTIKANV
jgi:hypothetical protein